MSEIYTSTIHNNRSMVIRSTPIQYIELVLETQRRSQHGAGSYPVQTSGASYEQQDTEGVVSEYPCKDLIVVYHKHFATAYYLITTI